MTEPVQDARWGWWLLLAVVVAVHFLFPLALDIPLLDPDEGLHASIAQEMVERGDLLAPRLFGRVFLDKPVLYFWAEAASLALFGMHEAAVRLPGLLFAIMGVATTGLVGWRMFGRTAGLLSALFYATTVLPTAMAQAASHDVALVPWVNLAILLFWEADHAGTARARWGLALAIGLLLGLSVLTKGLVGVALVGVSYGSYLLVTRRLTAAACKRGALALAVALGVALPWYLAMEARSPGYLHYYFVERHLLGFATDTQLHGGEPWWFYLPILLGGGLPWIVYLPVLLLDGWQRKKNGTAAPASQRCGAIPLLGCWVLGCTAILSLAGSKLPTYLWPAFPPVAVLAAVVWTRLFQATLSAEARRLVIIVCCGSCAMGPFVLPVAMAVTEHKFELGFSPATWTIALGIASVSVLPAVCCLRNRYRQTLAVAALAVAAQFVMIVSTIVPAVAEAESAKELAHHFNDEGRLPARVFVAEERIGSLVFYLEPALRRKLAHDQLTGLRLFDFDDTPVFVPGAVIALPENELQEATGYLLFQHAPYCRAGRYRVYDALSLQLRTAQADPPLQCCSRF